MKRIWILTALVLAVSTCASAECGAKINELRDSWIKNWNEKKLDKVIELYAPDATMLPSDGQRIVGRESIRAFLKRYMDSGNIEESVQSIATDCAGKIGFDSGTFVETIQGAGSTQRAGNYLVALREVSGKWRIVQHASIEARPAAGQ